MADLTPACPFCGSTNTTSTPLSGPGAVYYCRDCDRSLGHGDL